MSFTLTLTCTRKCEREVRLMRFNVSDEGAWHNHQHNITLLAHVGQSNFVLAFCQLCLYFLLFSFVSQVRFEFGDARVLSLFSVNSVYVLLFSLVFQVRVWVFETLDFCSCFLSTLVMFSRFLLFSRFEFDFETLDFCHCFLLTLFMCSYFLLFPRFEFDFETLERVKVNQAFKYPLTLDMEPFVEGRAWIGNDNSDESQVWYHELCLQQYRPRRRIFSPVCFFLVLQPFVDDRGNKRASIYIYIFFPPRRKSQV